MENIYLKKIPKTSLKSYISGWEALNTPNNHSSADWYPINFWYSKNKDETIKLYNCTHEFLNKEE